MKSNRAWRHKIQKLWKCNLNGSTRVDTVTLQAHKYTIHKITTIIWVLLIVSTIELYYKHTSLKWSCSHPKSSVTQRQTAATAYLKSKQLLLFDFAPAKLHMSVLPGGVSYHMLAYCKVCRAHHGAGLSSSVPKSPPVQRSRAMIAYLPFMLCVFSCWYLTLHGRVEAVCLHWGRPVCHTTLQECPT